MSKACPTCGQSLSEEVSDDAIVRALRGFSRTGRRGPIPHALYAAARVHNTKEADFTRWYVTGPSTRAGFVRGPFPLEQVQRLAKAGKIKPDYVDQHGEVHVYIAT